MKIKVGLVLLVLFLISVDAILAQTNPFANYQTNEFKFLGHDATIVFPKKSNNQRFWVWRARFWGHEPQTDLALLDKGFHIVYVDVAGLYGNDEAVHLWDRFYKYLRREYKLNRKAVLEGMSRGGLIVYNWASKNTKKVACIYADAPVCDIKSWPGGLYKGKGSANDWKLCLQVYRLDSLSVQKFNDIPLNNAVKVARARIPALHVCGLADEVVPYDENTKVLAENFRNAGGDIKLILKEGVGHHPHSLKDPKPIVDFIIDNTVMF